jgi:hypothetical protein
MKNLNTQSSVAGAAPPSAKQLPRTVHSAAGVATVRFVMHPSYAKLARSIDALNRESRQAPGARYEPAPLQVRSITREEVLTALAGAPVAGLTATQVCQRVLGKPDDRGTHRIAAVLARETKRGLVQPSDGRGGLRALTQRGRQVAAEMELCAARGKALVRRSANNAQRARVRAQELEAGSAGRVNGVFDYARKISLGMISAGQAAGR